MTSRSCDQRAHWTASYFRVAFFSGVVWKRVRADSKANNNNKKIHNILWNIEQVHPTLSAVNIPALTRAGFQEEAKLEHMPGGSTHG